jgi:N-acetylglucosamine-6-sulfatase
MLRPWLTRHPFVVGFAVALGAAILAVPAVAPTAGAASNDRRPVSPPNVVFVMLDDVSTGYMDAMPNVSRRIISNGTEYVNSVIPTSLCCPSRAATLTGKLAHTTGVYGNGADHGAWQTFQAQEGDTLATNLHQNGYTTALIGKYLNGFQKSPDGYTPAGWDTFIGFRTTDYYNWSTGGTVNETFGDSPEDYSTDVLSDYAVDFVNNANPDKPLFLYYSPFAAHKPFIPAPRHEGTWHNESLYGAFNEKNMSDKPQFMQDKEKLVRAREVRNQRLRHEMLMSVDEGFARIWDALADRVDNSIFVLMGDNGWMQGDHRMWAKDMPYRHSSGVPMAVRWDGHLGTGVSERVTANIDLTATIAEATGTTMDTEGRSVISTHRTGVVLEQMDSLLSLPTTGARPDRSHPAYCGYRTARYLYVEYTQAEGRELYDYSVDPNELHNKVNRDAYARVVERMRGKAQVACSPTPYGFAWGE